MPSFPSENLSQKKRKIFDSRTKRYRIIGHIRYRPKNLAIHFKRQYWKLLCRTVPCLHVVRLNESFGSRKLFRQLSTQQWENSFSVCTYSCCQFSNLVFGIDKLRKIDIRFIILTLLFKYPNLYYVSCVSKLFIKLH